MTLRKAAEQALEALEANLGKWAAKGKAVEALRQALAEPKREWVGLTDEEIHEMTFHTSLIRYFEAKLKEKNT